MARAFYAEGKLAEMDGRTEDAAESYLDTIRLGDASARGGVVVHWLVGRTIEGMGIEGLYKLRNMLTPKQCRELIHVLQTLDADREPLQKIWIRDDFWESHAFGWRARLYLALGEILGTHARMRPATDYVDKRTRAQMQVLICELALLAYHVQHDRRVRKLSDLVPEYLPSVPEDPYTGKPLVYRPKPKGHVLYSTGLNPALQTWGTPPAESNGTGAESTE